MNKKRLALGRSLDALLGDAVHVVQEQSNAQAVGQATGMEIAIERIAPGRYQPRKQFAEDKLEELALSIKAQGVIQPVLVRVVGDGYELIAGERRWRAAQRAGLRSIPAVVKELPDQTVMAVALIENIQRQDLSPLEEARAARRLLDEFKLTHQQAADAIGRSRVAVSNLVRLLDLEAEVSKLLEDGAIEMGHARALLALNGKAQCALAKSVVTRGLSVRQTESEVRKLLNERPKKEGAVTERRADSNITQLERELAEKLAAPVAISFRGGRGELKIGYGSLDELEGILARIR
jgi:ParB family chromosome partitioning protein